MSIRPRIGPKLGLVAPSLQQKQNSRQKVKGKRQKEKRQNKGTKRIQQTASRSPEIVKPNKYIPGGVHPQTEIVGGGLEKQGRKKHYQIKDRNAIMHARPEQSGRSLPSSTQIRRQRRRGLDIITSRVREYESKSQINTNSNKDLANGINARSVRQPRRPNQIRKSQDGGYRHGNLIKHSKAVFLQHGVGVMGDSTKQDYLPGGGPVAGISASDFADDEPVSTLEPTEKTIVARARSIIKEKELPPENDEIEIAEEAKLQANRMALEQKLEKQRLEEEKRLEEEQNLTKARRQAEEAEALARFRVNLEEEKRKQEEMRLRQLLEEHSAIQKKFELFSSPLRPKSSVDGKYIENQNEKTKENSMRVQERPSTRQGHENAPDNYDPATLNLTPVVLPFHLDLAAQAEAARKAQIAEEAAKRSEEAQTAAAALAAEIASELELANANATSNSDAGVADMGKNYISNSTLVEDKASASLDILSHQQKSDETDDKKIIEHEEGTESLSPQTDVKEANSNNLEMRHALQEALNEGKDTKEEEKQDARPVLKVYRRSRPSIAGIRQMLAPTDAASALRFSSAMFHRSPRARRYKWDTSFPLPPDSEVCCRRGLDLLQQNKVQDAIFWFSVGYGQEADTYADGTMGGAKESSKRLSSYEKHKIMKKREHEEMEKKAAIERGEEWNEPKDPYFAQENVPKDLSICAPRTLFDFGILCIVSRGIAYSRLGCWSQALWDFEEAHSMADGHCLEATLLCARAREARGETRKALKRVTAVLDAKEFLVKETSHIRPTNINHDQEAKPADRTQAATDYADVLYSQALSLRAKCLSGLKEHLKALRCYDESVARDSANTEALWARTRLFLDPLVRVGEDEKSRKRAALADLTNLVALDPGCPEYLEDAVDMFVDLAEYEEGLAVVNVLIQVWKNSGLHKEHNVLQNKSQSTALTKNQEAKSTPSLISSISSSSISMPVPTKETCPLKYQIFVAIFPDRKPTKVQKRQLALAQCLRARLRALSGLSLRKQVLPELQSAIDLEPSLPHPYLYRAALRHPAGLVEAALANNKYNKEAKLLEKFMLSKFRSLKKVGKKNTQSKRKEIEELSDIIDMAGFSVIQDLSTAIDISPCCVEALVLRASMYIRNGMFTPALHDLRDAAYFRQDLIEVWLLIGKIYLQHFHDYDSAANAASYAINLDSAKKEAYYIRAEARIRSGETDLALHEYSKLIRLDPTDPWPWLFQGQVLAEKGRARLALYSTIAYIKLLNPVKHAQNENGSLTPFSSLIANNGSSNVLSISYLEAQKAKLPKTLATLQALNKAAQEYRHAASLNPSVESTCLLADVLINLGDVSESLKVLLLALEDYDGNYQVHAALGRVYLSMEDYDHAIDEFGVAIEMEPQNAALHNALGVCKTLAEQSHLSHVRDLELQRSRTGGFEQLTEDYIERRAYENNDMENWSTEDEDNLPIGTISGYTNDTKFGKSRKKKRKRGGKQATHRGRRKKKKNKYKSSRKDSHTASPTRMGQQKSLKKRQKEKGTRRRKRQRRKRQYARRRRRAHQRLQEHAKMTAESKVPFVPKTREDLFEEVGMSGLGSINRCVTLDPCDTEAILNRAELYARAGFDFFAHEDFATVLDLEPDNVRAHINRGVLQMSRGRPAVAIADFDRALSLKPDTALALYNRAVAYSKMRQYDQAIHDYSATLSIVPDAVEALRNRGLLHLASGNIQNAREDLSAVLSLLQDTSEEASAADLLPALGHCNAHLGSLVPSALDAVNMAMKHRGGVLVDALVSRGSVFFSLAKAGYVFSEMYNQAEPLHTHNSLVANASLEDLESGPNRHPNLAQAKSHMKWVKLSIADFSKALRLDPTSSVIRTNLAEALCASASVLSLVQQIEDKNSENNVTQIKTPNDAKQNTKSDSTLLVSHSISEDDTRGGKSDHIKDEHNGRKGNDIQRSNIKIKLRNQNTLVSCLSVAYRHFSAVIRADPDYVAALTGRGMCNFKMGRLQHAIADLSDALAHIDNSNKQKSTNILEIARVRKVMNDLSKDEDETKKKPSANPHNENGSRNAVKTDSIATQLLRAQKVQIAHQKCDCLVNRATIYSVAGNARRAEADLLLTVSLGNINGFPTPIAFHDLGVMRLRSGKFEEALFFLDKAVEAVAERKSLNVFETEIKPQQKPEPPSLESVPLKSTTTGNHGAEPAKLQANSESSKVEPITAMIHMTRGIALSAQTPPKLDAALIDFNIAAEANPLDTIARYNRSIARAILGDLRGAHSDLSRAIAIASNDSRLYEQRGKVSAALSRHRVALKDFATALLLENASF